MKYPESRQEFCTPKSISDAKGTGNKFFRSDLLLQAKAYAGNRANTGALVQSPSKDGKLKSKLRSQKKKEYRSSKNRRKAGSLKLIKDQKIRQYRRLRGESRSKPKTLKELRRVSSKVVDTSQVIQKNRQKNVFKQIVRYIEKV